MASKFKVELDTLYLKGHFLCFTKQINICQLCLKFASKQFSKSRSQLCLKHTQTALETCSS